MQIRLSLRWSPMLYVPKSDVLTKFGNALRNHKVYQGGESHDFRGLKNGGFLSKSVIQVRLSLIFPLILIRLAWDLKQIARKMTATCSS